MARAIDADELEMFPYSEGAGTEEQISEWIEQTGLSEDDTASRARDLCWKVIDGFINVVKTQPPLTPSNEPLVTGFDVVDTKTGEYPDLEKIALKEDWAKHLMYCDMEGFAIEEDGTLLLLDECGRQACCPVGRFEIRRPPEGEEET